MKKEETEERDWSLVRNNNGEWISDRNVVFLTELELTMEKIAAQKCHLPLTVNIGPDGTKWCYKHELDAISAATPVVDIKPYKLKIAKTSPHKTQEMIEKYIKRFEETKDSDTLFEDLQSMSKCNVRKPDYIDFKLDTKASTLLLYIQQKQSQKNRDVCPNYTCRNMQTDNAAFEGWAVCMKAWLPDIEKVVLRWDEPKDFETASESIQHYNRFLYRVMSFSEAFKDWFAVDSSNQVTIEEFSKRFCYLQNNAYGKAPEKPSKEGSETKTEYEMSHTWADQMMTYYNLNVISRQLPIGVLQQGKSFFTGGKSAIDLWGMNDDTLTLIELKYNYGKSVNKKVGIISELFLYACTMRDMVLGIIQPPTKSPTKEETMLYERITSFRRVKAEMLSNGFHPLLDNEAVLTILNRNAFNENIPITFGKTKYDFTGNHLTIPC